MDDLVGSHKSDSGKVCARARVAPEKREKLVCVGPYGVAVSRFSGLMTSDAARASCRYFLALVLGSSWEKISRRLPSGSKKQTLFVSTWSAVNSTRAP